MSGEGSLYRRASDGRWVAAISSGPRGSRKIRRVYRHTRAEAKAALEELRSRGAVNRSTITVGAFLGSWVRDARDIRPNTRHGYEVAVMFHLTPALGDIRLADLSPLHVEQALAQLGPTLSPKSLRNVHGVLRRALGQAVRAGLVERNVASREFVDAPRVTSDEPDALSEDEIRVVIAAAKGDRIEAHVLIGLGTGLRQGEQLGLAWEDLDLTAGRLYVRKELDYRNGKYDRVEPKTPRSKRMVPLGPSLVAALQAHRDALKAAGFAPIDTGPVFPSDRGREMSGSVLTHRWYELQERAGVRRRPWKVLRATFASRLYALGVSDQTVAGLLGHARTHTTRRHYITTPGAMTAAEAMEGIVADTHPDTHGLVVGGGQSGRE